MDVTKPLDALIDKFDIAKKVNVKREKESVPSLDVYLDLWHENVEMINPTYFSIEDGKNSSEILDSEVYPKHLSQTSRDVILYDTTLGYLLSVIQNFIFTEPKEGEDRIKIYSDFLRLEKPLLDSIQKAIDLNEKLGLKYNILALKNAKRSIEYHFASEDIKKLIINSNSSDGEMVIHDITRIPLYIHMMSAIVCLSMSTFFHWFSCWNEKVNNYLSRLDYGGISFLIAGSCMPPYFYSFYCEETIMFAYAYSILIFTI